MPTRDKLSDFKGYEVGRCLAQGGENIIHLHTNMLGHLKGQCLFPQWKTYNVPDKGIVFCNA